MNLKNIIYFFAFAGIVLTSNAFAKEKLIFSIDLIRHGDRTPLREIPKSPYVWREGLGQLTAKGRDQEYQLGVQARKKYVIQYHLLPSDYSNETVYVRSTDKDRTIASANAFLSGLYPPGNRPAQHITIHIAAKPGRNIFSLISLYFYKRKIWNEKTINIHNKIKLWSEQTGLPLNDFQQLDYLADNLYIRKLHHVPLPKGISSDDANQIISLGNWGIINAFKFKNITHPMGHELLKPISNYLEQAARQKTALKYILFSGHDSSIMSVMNELGTPLDEIPGYAADLNFSLFENNKRYYVKINYNNKPITIPACGGNTCALSQFYALAQA